MVSARRVMCGALIIILGAYLFYLKNDAFGVSSILGGESWTKVFYYVPFILLAATIAGGYLLYKDLTVGAIIAISCAGVVLVLIIVNLFFNPLPIINPAGWAFGGPYALDEQMQHFHKILQDILLPGIIVAFGLVGLGSGEE